MCADLAVAGAPAGHLVDKLRTALGGSLRPTGPDLRDSGQRPSRLFCGPQRPDRGGRVRARAAYLIGVRPCPRQRRRRGYSSRGHLPGRRPASQSGHHRATLSRRTARVQGHRGGGQVGAPARRHLAHALEYALSVPAPAVVASRAEGMMTPLHRFNNDMVFIDGRALQSAGWEGELDENTYSIDYEGGYVYIKHDPSGHLLEITARDSALVVRAGPVRGKAADHKGPLIRGIMFTQYAYRALEVEGKDQFPLGGADRRPGRAGRSRHLRQGGCGNRVGGLHPHALLEGRRLLPRRPAGHP